MKDTERKFERMSKVLEERAELLEKYNESESLRKKFMEKNSNLDKEVKKY